MTSRFGVERRRLFSAEDCVLRDAEGGIRLMPLREWPEEPCRSVKGNGVMDEETAGKVGRGVFPWGQAQILWKWLRGG